VNERKPKEFGKLSRNQLRSLYASYHKLKQEQEELKAEISQKKEELKGLVRRTGAWGQYYQFSTKQVLALFLVASGLDAEVIRATDCKDPQQKIIDLTESDWKPKDLSKEEEGVLLGLYFAHIGNFNSLAMFNRTVSDLVQDSMDDKDALFKAIYVDRSSMQAEPIAQRICHAQLVNDTSFFDRLAKAVTRTKPSRPKPEYDDVRFMLEILNDSLGLTNITHEKLYELVVDDLELYPDNGKDPMSSLKKLIQKRNYQSRN